MHNLRLHPVVARVTLALILFLRPPGATRAELPLGVAAGDTTQTSSVLWTKTKAAGTVSYQIATDAAFTNAEFRAKHVEVCGPGATATSTLAALRSATSVCVTIDDHEVTNDFSGGVLISSDPRFSGTPTDRINDSALFNAGLQAFVEYNSIRDTTYGVVGGDGRSSSETMRQCSSSTRGLSATRRSRPGPPSSTRRGRCWGASNWRI